MSDTILVERDGPVGIVTLNRPQAMNALSSELRGALCEAMRALGADDEIRAVVLTGAGERAFTAGLDLKELGSSEGGVFDAVSFDPTANPVRAMAELGKPIVGAINGVAVTGGFEIALACDILIASTNARFADTHVKVQVMPGWGLSQKLSRMIGMSRAKEMSLTGMFVGAEQAERWGLVNRVVKPAELVPAAVSIAKAIAANAPSMVAEYRVLMDEGFDKPFGEAMAYEADKSQEFNGRIQATDIEGRREAVRASNRA